MNCKQGDLAIVIRSIIPENMGKIVKVGEFYGDQPRLGLKDAWRVELPSQATVKHEDGGLRISMKGLCPDAWPRPVSGLPDEDTTDTEHPIKIEEPA